MRHLGVIQKGIATPVAPNGFEGPTAPSPPDSAPAMVTLRPLQPDDLPTLYAIALATGHKGGDASHLHRDGDLVGHIYAAPYALLNPGIALVAVDSEGMAGYAVAASDTAAWEEALERRW